MQRSKQQWGRLGLVGAFAAAAFLAACQDSTSAPTSPLRTAPTGGVSRAVFSHPGMIQSMSAAPPNSMCGVSFYPPSGYEDVGSWDRAWTINGSPIANGEYSWNYMNSGSPYTIGLTATDAYGDTLTDSFTVGITTSGAACLWAFDDGPSPTYPTTKHH